MKLFKGIFSCMLEENQQRIAAAEEYLRKHGPHHRVFRRLNRMVQKRVQPQIVITVVTVARQPQSGVTEPRYLTQVVTQFAELLEHEEAADVVFQVSRYLMGPSLLYPPTQGHPTAKPPVCMYPAFSTATLSSRPPCL